MAITLADLAKQEKSPLKKGVLLNLLRYSNLLGLVPFENADSLTNIVVRWKTLPSTGFRKIGGTYSESTGTTEQITEGVYALGGEIKFDRVFDMVKNTIEDPKVTQTKMKSKAIAFSFNDYFINGDHAVDADGFEGLNKRIASYLPTRQNLALSAAFDPTASTANEHTLVDNLHNLIDLAGLRKGSTVKYGGKGTTPAGTDGALLMNRDTFLGVARVLRRLSLLDTTQDNFGREISLFDSIPLVDVGLKADQSTEIIANTYGAGGNETRIFAVRFGTDDGLTGIQLNNPDAYDPIAAGEGAGNTTGPQKLLRIDWWVGLAGFGSYYAARLTGLKAPTAWT